MGSPKMPATPPAPEVPAPPAPPSPPPMETDADIAQEKEALAKRRKKKGGRQSTILTEQTNPSAGGKTLLGE